VVHAAVDHHRPATRSWLDRQDLGDQRAGPGDQGTAGLDLELGMGAGHQRGEGSGELLWGRDRAAAVVDREAAADVDPVEGKPEPSARFQHFERDRGPVDQLARAGELGADVDVDCDRVEVGVVAGRDPPIQLDRGACWQAELGLVVPGLQIGVETGFHVWVDP
jgi:hypothetical protein